MATDDNTLDDTMFDMNQKKKSTKKRKNRNVLSDVTDSINSVSLVEPTNDTETIESDYSYDYLITRAFDMMPSRDRQDTVNISALKLSPPQLARIGTIKTSFVNFGSMCKSLKRSEKCLYEFFRVELGGASCSIDANHSLIMRGRFQQKHIENILRLFIKEYVICKTCRSPDTLLGKVERLTMLKCATCQSHYSVSNIKNGFQAQIGRRPRDN